MLTAYDLAIIVSDFERAVSFLLELIGHCRGADVEECYRAFFFSWFLQN